VTAKEIVTLCAMHVSGFCDHTREMWRMKEPCRFERGVIKQAAREPIKKHRCENGKWLSVRLQAEYEKRVCQKIWWLKQGELTSPVENKSVLVVRKKTQLSFESVVGCDPLYKKTSLKMYRVTCLT